MKTISCRLTEPYKQGKKKKKEKAIEKVDLPGCMIVIVFPGIGKYNNLKLPQGGHSLYLNHFKNKQGYPDNVVENIKKIACRHPFIFLPSDPKIRSIVCRSFTNVTFLYEKASKKNFEKVLERIKKVDKNKPSLFQEKIQEKWWAWHKNGKRYCENYNIPYYEYSSQEEFENILNNLRRKGNENPDQSSR